MTQHQRALPPGDWISTETVPTCQPRAQQPPETARWNAAEERIYPLVMIDPDLYEASVTLVGQALDVLRSQCGTVAELTSADPAVVVRQCSATSTVAALGLDPGVVFDAACAYRLRELTADPADAAVDAGDDRSG
jgi:hypothetical protein